MKKMLKCAKNEVYHRVNGKRVEGVHGALRGDVSDIYGDVFGIYGDVTGLKGDVTGLTGNIDGCELTEDDRKQGIDITELIG